LAVAVDGPTTAVDEVAMFGRAARVVRPAGVGAGVGDLGQLASPGRVQARAVAALVLGLVESTASCPVDITVVGQVGCNCGCSSQRSR
jgi:hypothetical protein